MFLFQNLGYFMDDPRINTMYQEIYSLGYLTNILK